jgi:hypothetical protein
MNSKKLKKPTYRKWKCEVIIPNGDYPMGLDGPPRMAVKNALWAMGIEILSCSSGWGQEVTKDDISWLKAMGKTQKRQLKLVEKLSVKTKPLDK